jgi:hypothetical protein
MAIRNILFHRNRWAEKKKPQNGETRNPWRNACHGNSDAPFSQSPPPPNPANIALPCIEPRILISQFLLDTLFGRFVALNVIWPGLRFPSGGLATRLLELASFQSKSGISPLAMHFTPSLPDLYADSSREVQHVIFTGQYRVEWNGLQYVECLAIPLIHPLAQLLRPRKDLRCPLSVTPTDSHGPVLVGTMEATIMGR